MQDDRGSGPLWRDVAIIAFLTVLLTVPGMFTRDLWGPDEPRYMEVAREMVALHNYVIPHLNNRTYADKPPMFFWLAGGLYRTGFGLNSGRVLAALAALGTLLATYLLSRRFLEGDGPLIAALATLGTALFLLNAPEGVINPVLTLTESGAVLFGFVALRAPPGRGWRWWLPAYGLAAAAVLTKGPVGVLLPAAVLAVYGLLDRAHVRPGGRAHLAGVLLFGSIVAAWLVPALLVGGRRYADAILLQSSMGPVVGIGGHRNPFYYYLLKLPVLLLPWTLLLVPAAIAAARRPRDEAAGPGLFALVWLAATVAFFSCVSGKRSAYLMPMSPAVGVLLGWYLTAGCRRQRAWTLPARAMLAACGAGVVVLMVLAFYPEQFARLIRMAPRHGAALTETLGLRWRVLDLALLALPLACCVAGLLYARRRPRLALAGLATAMVLTSVWHDVSVDPLLNRTRTPKAFCDTIVPYLCAGRDLYMDETPFAGAINLYLKRVHIPVLKGPRQVRAALADPDALIISDSKRSRADLGAQERQRHTLAQATFEGSRMFLLRGIAPGRVPDP